MTPRLNGTTPVVPFRISQQEWDQLRAESQDAVEKIEIMQVTLGKIEHNTKALEALPLISAGIDAMNKNLVGPATGKKQVPMSAFVLQSLVMAGIIVVLLLKDSKTSFDLSKQGLRIQQHEAVTP